MKTTLELPDPLFREVKATAALNGMKIKDFVAEALVEKLKSSSSNQPRKPWMNLAGRAASHPEMRAELEKLDQVVEAAFSTIEESDWQ